MLSDLRCELDNHSTAGDSEKRAPEVFHGVLRIDVANVTESKRHSRDCDSGREERCGDSPAQSLGPVKELPARRDIPADLKMHGQGANENPYSDRQSTRDEESAREGASQARVHIVRRNFIVALLRLCAEGNDKSKGHEHRSDDQAVTQVVSTGLLSRKNQEGYHHEDQTDEASDVQSFRYPVPCVEFYKSIRNVRERGVLHLLTWRIQVICQWTWDAADEPLLEVVYWRTETSAHDYRCQQGPE